MGLRTLNVLWNGKLNSSIQRKAPLQVRAKLAAKKEQRLAELEEENPEKAELIKEKKRWKDAETRLKGEKVKFIQMKVDLECLI